MKPFTSIAIIGGGICGLATAFSCLERGVGKIKIFDLYEPGHHPRAIQAGLLHPYPGMRAKPIPDFDQMQRKTVRLLNIAQMQSDQTLFATCGLFRIASSFEREQDFQSASIGDPLALYPAILSDFAPQRVEEKSKRGLWISNALAVHLPRYQRGLWLYLQSRGVEFEKARIESVNELLKSWQIAIIAGGFGSASLEQGAGQLKPLMGQWFVLKAPDGSDLKIGLSDRAYAFPIPGTKGEIFAGSTFEHTDKHLKAPDSQGVQLLSDCRRLIDIPELTVIKYGSSLRCSTPDHLPINKWLTDRIGVITAMGSKGLARHAACAEQLIATHPSFAQ